MATKKQAAKVAAPAKEIALVTAADALRAKRRDKVVEDGSTYEVGDEDCTRVGIAGIEDLQRLSLLPESLKPELLLKAIREDDAAALEQARRLPFAAADCGCDGGDDATEARAPHPVATLRQQYGQLRRRFHPTLARALSDVHGQEVAWDSPLAIHAHRWVHQLQAVRRFELVLVFWQDLTVGRNATLQLATTRRMLWARHIRIHTGGRIRTGGSYLKIKCASIQGNLA